MADDHGIVRAGLRRLLENSGDMCLIGEAETGREAIRKVQEKMPDVAVIDISMPDMDGLEVISQLHSSHPELPILVLTMHEEPQYVIRTIGAGAMGYVTKGSAHKQLVKAIRKLHAGGRYLTESAAEALAFRLAKGKLGFSLLDSLSNRELQVLRCLALGKTNREIARDYNISDR